MEDFLTVKEIVKKYKLSQHSVVSNGLKRGYFAPDEIRTIGPRYLIKASAAERAWGQRERRKKSYEWVVKK